MLRASTRALHGPRRPRCSRLPALPLPYLARLRAQYPHADPPALVASFVVLHELTALVPLVALFALFHALGLGTGLVHWVLEHSEDGRDEAAGTRDGGGWRDTVRTWLREAEDKTERIGRRYGWFGWDKETPDQRKERREREKERGTTEDRLEDERLQVGGDVANLAAAYLVVKALIPLRILISLRLSPSLANLVVRRFRGLRERGKKYTVGAPSNGTVTGEPKAGLRRSHSPQVLDAWQQTRSHADAEIEQVLGRCGLPLLNAAVWGASGGPPVLPPLPRIFSLKRKSRSGLGPAGAEEEAGEKAEEEEEDHCGPRFVHASPIPDDEIVELPAVESTGDTRTEEDVADEEVAKVEGVRICWSTARRTWITALLSLLCTFVGICSSINASVAHKAAADLGVRSLTVMNLDTALFLTGFGLAAPIMAPLSELAGRNPVYLVSLAGLALLQVGAALSSTLSSRLVLRFLAGCFATTPLANAGAAVGDLWNEEERTAAFGVFGVGGLYVRPAWRVQLLRPVIGGFVAESALSYRWTDWLQAIGAGFLFLLALAVLPETYPPLLLGLKAAALRYRRRSPVYHSPLEYKRTRISFAQDFRRTLARPFLMLVKEPIVACFCAYMTVVFIVLFGNLTAFPHIFAPYALSPSLSGLTFLSTAVGLVLCGALTPFMLCDYRRVVGRADNEARSVEPEVRLRVAMLGTWAVPLGLYWSAWVCYRRISLFATLGAQALAGFGFLCCFYSTFLYLIDSYGHAAASALSSNSFLRYPIAGGAVLFIGPMYARLNPHWALTLLGSISLVMSCIPFVFYRYGCRIRSWSRYTVP
ncbi:hypothetical protein Rhopal_000104-T1 [Rhodotorula paludigena]|uniref:MFS general substrate transporter n=1 Tax=Rhodotorula paludigena TaxID=86838 RepID=A0AAV5G9Q7_9BASI|nr:hypothetical protein Rhopal_000104-T1 [Rhodotorula paludigena]